MHGDHPRLSKLPPADRKNVLFPVHVASAKRGRLPDPHARDGQQAEQRVQGPWTKPSGRGRIDLQRRRE